MLSRLRILVSAALAAAVLAGPSALAQEQPEFLNRLFGRGEPARDEPPQRVAQASPTDVVVRLDRLEGLIRQLTGTVEQLQFRNQQLEQQVRRFQEDSEARFQELGAGGTARPAARPAAQPGPRPPAGAVPAAPPPPGAPPAPGRRSDAFDPIQDPGAPGAPRTLGALPSHATAVPPPPAVAPEPGLPEPPPVGAPGGRSAGTPLDLATLAGAREPLPAAGVPPVGGSQLPPPRPPGTVTAVLPPSQTPRDEYDLAYGYVLRKDYALAEDQFRSFLRKYPSDRLASDAHYWLGESLFQRQRYLDAAELFLAVSTKYETAGKAPDALLRLGQSLAALGEKEQACAALGRIGVKYPRASAGIKQGVEREQKRARC